MRPPFDNEAKEIGRGILSGNAAVYPYRIGRTTACDYCPYGDVCGFDRGIGGYRYRDILSGKDKDILARMEEEVNRGNRLDG